MSNSYFKYPELLSPPIRRAAYSDRTAWLMAEMSQLAYIKFEESNDKLEGLKKGLAEAGFELIQSFNCSGTQAFLAKRDSDKIAVLSFRGTQIEGLTLETFFDVFIDLYAGMRVDKNGVKTHKGFQLGFELIEQEVLLKIKELEKYALYITGHSLGGGLALIATKALNSDNLAACYTFGSPKVGNEEFDDEIKPPIYRVINAYDVVPFLPFTRIMLPMFWLISNKIKNEKIKILIENFKEYQHHGFARYLTHASNNDAKLSDEYDECSRALKLIQLSFTGERNIGVQHHSLDAYCEKLAQWALRRNEPVATERPDAVNS